MGDADLDLDLRFGEAYGFTSCRDHVERRRRQPQSVPAPRHGVRLGERLRQLRVAAGLTQSELAGERFSKEYVSQIERGKTRPTSETITWLAARLGVDPGFLSNGVSAEERGRVEATLARAEALLGSGSFPEAVAAFQAAHTQMSGVPELEVLALVGESRGRIQLGEHPRGARSARTRALDRRRPRVLRRRARRGAALARRLPLQAVERPDLRSGCSTRRWRSPSARVCRATRSGRRSHSWRSRCYRRQRDFEGAREDVEIALELAQGLGDRRGLANAYFQASLIAEREGHWLLARTYAERAKSQYEELEDSVNIGRLMNNLGGLQVLLGKPEMAVSYLKDAFRIALDVGNEGGAAQAVSSLAQVHLRAGDLDQAEEQARYALELLDGRVDFLDEIGNAQLTLGRSLLEQGRLDEAGDSFAAAEESFSQLSSASHRAAAWVAQGDLAARRGDDRKAAHLFRAAAEALQDFRF